MPTALLQPLAWEPPYAAGVAKKKKKEKKKRRSSLCSAAETNLARNHEVEGLIPALAQWVEDPVFL